MPSFVTYNCHFIPLFSFVSPTNQQTDVTLVKRFNQWEYNWQNSLEKRMPWLGAKQSLLTTSTHSDYSDWGSIISEKMSNNPAPWIYGVMANPGVIWYWVNEDDCDQSRNAGECTEAITSSGGEGEGSLNLLLPMSFTPAAFPFGKHELRLIVIQFL